MIDILIAKLYPYKVEYKPLKDCYEILNNKRRSIAKENRQKGQFPYHGANGVIDYVPEYIFDGVFFCL